MGVIKDTKKFIKKKVDSAIEKAENGLADAAQLSSNQITAVAERKEQYMNQLSAGNANESGAVTAEIEKCIGAVSIEVYQAYLQQLKRIYHPKYFLPKTFNAKNRIKVMSISRLVVDSEETSLDKLVNVYAVLSREVCNIALIYKRGMDGTTVSIGIVNTSEDDDDPTIIDSYYKRVHNALQGNFPGIGLCEDAQDDDFSLGSWERQRSGGPL